MDPSECLRMALEKALELQRLEDLGPETDDLQELTSNCDKIGDLGSEIAQHLLDLNEWITRGGFLPDQWRPCTQCGPQHGTNAGRCLRHGKLVLTVRPQGTPE